MKSKISVHDRETLARGIAALTEATLADLKSRWRVLYGTEPPPRISRDLLTRAVAYRIQEKALGGLKPSTRRLLAKVAADASARRPIQVTPAPTLTPGTVLLRDWRGTQHQVIVREHGVEFQGKRYKSLSQVAHRITGSKCSWPPILDQRDCESAGGKDFDADGEPLYAQGAAKAGRRYRYYVSEAWLPVPRAMKEKASASLHPSSNERWRLPRSTSSAIAPGCWRCWHGRGYNRPT